MNYLEDYLIAFSVVSGLVLVYMYNDVFWEKAKYRARRENPLDKSCYQLFREEKHKFRAQIYSDMKNLLGNLLH